MEQMSMMGEAVPFSLGQSRSSQSFFAPWRTAWFTAVMLASLDAVIWGAVFFSVLFLREAAPAGETGWSWIAACGLGVSIVMIYLIGGYDRKTDMVSLTYAAEHLLTGIAAAAVGAIAVYVLAAFDGSMRPSRSVLALSFILFSPLSLVARRAVAARYSAGLANRRFLVIGNGPIAQHFYEVYRQSSLSQTVTFAATRFDGLPGAARITDGASPLVCPSVIAELQKLSKEVDGIVLAEEADRVGLPIVHALTRLNFSQIPVYTLEGFYEYYWKKIPALALHPLWPIQANFRLASDSPYLSVKRLLDIVISALALLVLFPLLLAIGLVVFLESGRPIIFRQERIGSEDRVFETYKFRTMRNRTDEGDMYTQKRDSRITRAGRWLRKLRLDELPQLWNVLKGDMSLIGPRAEWVKLVQLYEKEIPCYHFRHLVKPGITGWAQVNYPYGANLEDAVQKLTYDLYYIRHYSLKLDAMIVLKTIHVMLSGRGT